MFMSFRSFIITIAVVVMLATVCLLQGCSVNVIVAPHATLGVSSDLSQKASQLVVSGYADDAAYDCDFAPDADVCQ